MSAELLRPPEYKKIPQGFVSVIADDELYYAQTNEEALTTASKISGINHGTIYRAQDPMDLFYKALTGKVGNQADVVFLDDMYEGDLWQPPDKKVLYDQLSQFAQQAGLDLTPYVPLLAKRGDQMVVVLGPMPTDLYTVNSIHLSMLLRLLGYRNNVFIVSSHPPDVSDITDEMGWLREKVPSYRPNIFPVDGYVEKESFWRRKVLWARRPIINDRVQEWDIGLSVNTMSEGMSKLLGG